MKNWWKEIEASKKKLICAVINNQLHNEQYDK